MIQLRNVHVLAILVIAASGGLLETLATAQTTAGQSRLVRVLTGRSESVRTKALIKLRQDPPQLRNSLDDLIQALNLRAEAIKDSDVMPSMVEMVNLVGSVDRKESEAALIKLLDSSNANLAMVAADALGRNKFYGAIEHLQRQSERPEYDARYGFRFNLVHALAQMEHPDAIEILAQLEPKLDGQLRYEIEQILREVTLDNFRGDESRYQAFMNRSEQDTDSAPSSEEGSVFKSIKFTDERPASADEQIKFAQPQYYGIDIRARRVLFVLDHSGSMKKPTSSGSRLTRAKHELIRAITQLPDDSQFAVIAFDSSVRPWRDTLATATEEEKRAAIQYVQRLPYGSDTNTYGALRKSLEFDDSLEAVYLLTDGRPTAGQIIQPAQIVNDILHRNRWKNLNINAIGISVGGPTENFLRALADNSGGEFRAAQ